MWPIHRGTAKWWQSHSRRHVVTLRFFVRLRPQEVEKQRQTAASVRGESPGEHTFTRVNTLAFSPCQGEGRGFKSCPVTIVRLPICKSSAASVPLWLRHPCPTPRPGFGSWATVASAPVSHSAQIQASEDEPHRHTDQGGGQGDWDRWDRSWRYWRGVFLRPERLRIDGALALLATIVFVTRTLAEAQPETAAVLWELSAGSGANEAPARRPRRRPPRPEAPTAVTSSWHRFAGTPASCWWRPSVRPGCESCAPRERPWTATKPPPTPGPTSTPNRRMHHGRLRGQRASRHSRLKLVTRSRDPGPRRSKFRWVNPDNAAKERFRLRSAIGDWPTGQRPVFTCRRRRATRLGSRWPG